MNIVYVGSGALQSQVGKLAVCSDSLQTSQMWCEVKMRVLNEPRRDETP